LSTIPSVEALAFDPDAAIARPIGLISSLRDDPLKAMNARRLAKDFAVSALMLAVCHSRRRLFEELRESGLSHKQGLLGDVLPIDFDQIEGKVHQ
jgi:hypothetical protein